MTGHGTGPLHGSSAIPCRLLSEPPHTDEAGDVVIVCPWLRGLPPGDGLWLSALSVHDCNAVYETGAALPPEPAGRARLFFGVFALDRLRSDEHLFDILRARGVEAIVNLPSVGFFDGAMAASLAALGFDVAAELRFLAKAREHGFRTALCERGGAARDAVPYDRVLHAGPGSGLVFRPGGQAGPERPDGTHASSPR